MNNQLPENNMPQSDSEKTENVFQATKKPKILDWVGWFILVAAVLATGGGIWYYSNSSQEQKTKDYYQKLADKCDSDSCCIRSVETMRLNGYKQMPTQGCSEDYKKNQLLCLNSYIWCEPKETNDSSSSACGPEPPASCGTNMRLTCENGKWGCRETEENQKIIGKIIFSDIEGGCWGFQSDNGKYFFIGGDDKSEEIKKIPDILSKNVEIQGKIEKDIVHFCPVGDGFFKLESYRIISDNATDISDWKTYHNEKYGFELKYPVLYSRYSTDDENIILFTSQAETQVWDIRIAWIVQDTDKENIYDLGTFINSEYLKINSLDAIKFLPDTPPFTQVGYVLIHNHKEYDIEINVKDQKIMNDAEQILSTFKFLD